jgi:hypothetical protein
LISINLFLPITILEIKDNKKKLILGIVGYITQLMTIQTLLQTQKHLC